MRPDDQKNSLIDYVQFLILKPVRPGLENEMDAIRRAHGLLSRTAGGVGQESLLAMDLVKLLYQLRDKKLSLGY